MEFVSLSKGGRIGSHWGFLDFGMVSGMFVGTDQGRDLVQYLDTAASGLRMLQGVLGTADPHVACMMRAVRSVEREPRTLNPQPYPFPTQRADLKEYKREHKDYVQAVPEILAELSTLPELTVKYEARGGLLGDEYPWCIRMRYHPIDTPEATRSVEAWFTWSHYALLFMAYFASMDAMVRETVASCRGSNDPLCIDATQRLERVLQF